jgi:hypothetical protein
MSKNAQDEEDPRTSAEEFAAQVAAMAAAAQKELDAAAKK